LKRKTNTEKTDATRRALLNAGRKLFAKNGYGATSTESIVVKAKVTRGALYYHFKDKAELFAAVVEDLVHDTAAAIRKRAGTEEDPWELLNAAFDVFLDRCMDPTYQRIVLQEAPAVLSTERWEKMQARHSHGDLLFGVEKAIESGNLKTPSAEALASVLSGAIREAGFFISRAADKIKARQEIGATVKQLLDGLRIPR
jgi:AcrR family transcriptional regulator